MLPFFLLIFLFPLGKTENVNKTFCDGFQANFDMKSVIGTWYAVAIIPGRSLENFANTTCYEVEFSETDEAGLRWLVNNTLETETASNMVDRIKGPIIRQRYFSERPFDVWSRAISDVSGCFQQVLALDMDKSDFSKGLTSDAMMQLHIIETRNEQVLVQLLWGKMISAVVYRKEADMSMDALTAVFEFLGNIRDSSQPFPLQCFSTD